MTDRTWLRVVGRLGAILVTPIAFSLAVAGAGWAPVTLDIIDAMLISFAIGAAALFWPRMIAALASPEPFEATDFVTFGLYDLFFYAMLAGIWSVRARSNHGSAIYGADVELRIAFRFLAARCLVYFMVAQGYDADQRPTVSKWLRVVAIGLVAVTGLACVDIVRDHFDAASKTISRQDWSPGADPLDAR